MSRVDGPESVRPVADAAPWLTEAGAALPPPPLAQPAADAASPAETAAALAALDTELAAAIASGDPQVLMTAVAARLRTAQVTTAQANVRTNRLRADEEAQRQMEAYRRAEEAQAAASFWRVVSRVASYAVSGLAIVAGAASGVFTGGATTLASIGIVASLLSSTVTVGVMAAQDTGLVRGDTAVLSATMSLASLLGGVQGLVRGGLLSALGAAVSMTASAASATVDIAVAVRPDAEPGPELRWALTITGLAGGGVGALGAMLPGAASQATQAAARAASATAGYIRGAATVGQGLAQLAQGGATTVRAGWTHAADSSHVEVTERRAAVERLGDETGEVLEALRAALASFQRGAQRAMEVGQQVATSRRALLRNTGRA